MEKVDDTCPQDWFASQDYCIVATDSKRREVIRRVGRSALHRLYPWGGLLT